jgi:hypothetical protein
MRFRLDMALFPLSPRLVTPVALTRGDGPLGPLTPIHRKRLSNEVYFLEASLLVTPDIRWHLATDIDQLSP